MRSYARDLWAVCYAGGLEVYARSYLEGGPAACTFPTRRVSIVYLRVDNLHARRLLTGGRVARSGYFVRLTKSTPFNRSLFNHSSSQRSWRVEPLQLPARELHIDLHVMARRLLTRTAATSRWDV